MATRKNYDVHHFEPFAGSASAQIIADQVHWLRALSRACISRPDCVCYSQVSSVVAVRNASRSSRQCAGVVLSGSIPV